MSNLKTFLVEDSPVIRSNLIAALEDLAPVNVVGHAESANDACHQLTALEAAGGENTAIIDCCPFLGVLSLNAIFASDRILVPVSSDYLSLRGALQIEHTLKALEPVPVPAAATTDTSKSVANNDPATLGSGPNNFKTVQHVLEQRCYMCHGAQVQMKNVRLDTPEGVKTNAQMVYQQVVVLKQMPMNNATGLTEAERALIADRFKPGAKTQ